MGEETPENQGQTEEIEVEEWEIVEEKTFPEEKEGKDVTASIKESSATPPQTVITKPKKDRNKCPYCNNTDIFYDSKNDLYWCSICERVYQFEEEE